MLPDDLIPAALCQLIYVNPAYFDKIIDNGSVYAGIKVINEKFTITCRGSLTWDDWKHDLESAILNRHPVLGMVGSGFIEGVDDAFTQITKIFPFRPDVEIYGHSLGGAHAAYLAGLYKNMGVKINLITFESPKACGSILLDLLKDSDVICYRNGEDVVTDVPLGLQHPRLLNLLNCPPVTGDITPFKYHHMALAVCGIVTRQLE
jgi:Lipase (class 3)